VSPGRATRDPEGSVTVGLAVTAWRLIDATGRQARCIVSERDGRWHLLIEEGPTITVAERCASDDAAFDRANEIWQTLVAQGWTEPHH
jgi:hypothetical protein